VPNTREAEELAEGERDYALQLAESKEPPVPVFRKNSKSPNCQFQR
jgi:hypothetical protein